MTDAASADPIAHFATLYQQAAQTQREPDAMVLSTVDPDGRPSGRYSTESPHKVTAVLPHRGQ